jgi:predicted methyltransferase
MIRTTILACAATAFLFLAPSSATAKMVDNISSAVNDAARPDADKQLDAERKPGEMLALAHIRPGMKVMDLVPGGGYFTRLFAKAVGPKGYVYAFQPVEFAAFNKGKPAKVRAVAAEYPNVSVIEAPVNTLAAPEALDVVWTSQNYHDLHDSFAKPADLAIVNKKVFDSLKPGGVFIVLDHSAEKGSGLRDTETLHRIDEAAVKSEVEAAGFKLASESNILRNPADPRTAKVFDPSIRHKTDQFILIFRKPKH